MTTKSIIGNAWAKNMGPCCMTHSYYLFLLLYTSHNKKDERDCSFRKIYLSLYLKGVCVRGSWRPSRTATYWPSLYWPRPRSFPVLLGCSTGGLGPHSVGCWLSLPHLVTNWSGLQTDWISCALSYIIVQRPPSSCGRHSTHPRSRL